MNSCTCELCKDAADVNQGQWPPLPALDPIGIEAAIDRVELLQRRDAATIERLREANAELQVELNRARADLADCRQTFDGTSERLVHLAAQRAELENHVLILAYLLQQRCRDAETNEAVNYALFTLHQQEQGGE